MKPHQKFWLGIFGVLILIVGIKYYNEVWYVLSYQFLGDKSLGDSILSVISRVTYLLLSCLYHCVGLATLFWGIVDPGKNPSFPSDFNKYEIWDWVLFPYAVPYTSIATFNRFLNKKFK